MKYTCGKLEHICIVPTTKGMTSGDSLTTLDTVPLQIDGGEFEMVHIPWLSGI